MAEAEETSQSSCSWALVPDSLADMQPEALASGSPPTPTREDTGSLPRPLLLAPLTQLLLQPANPAGVAVGQTLARGRWHFPAVPDASCLENKAQRSSDK